MAPLKRYYGYWLALLAEVAAFYRHVLFGHGYLFPWDFRGVHMPLATFIAACLRRGEMPLWEPYTYCGNPLFANIQAALFYPPVLLATAASNLFGADSLPRLLALAVAVQVLFAGLCTFALLRRLGAAPGASFVAATVYQLGCFFAVQAEHMGAMHGGSWLPLAWWCVVELRERVRWRWMAILALALAMTVLSGLPQVAVAAFGSAMLLPLAVVSKPRRVVHIARVAAACCWALLLAAIQIAPTAQLTANSVAKYRAEWLKTGGGVKLGALYTLLLPNYWGVFDMSKFHGPSDPTFLYLYCGVLTLALAMAAMCWKPDRFTRAFTVFTLAATIWMLGDSTPIGRAIFLALPVDVRIGIHPEYTLPVFALCVAVLAGWGAHRFVPSRWQMAAGAIIAVDLLLVSSGRPFNTVSVAVEPGTTRDSLDGSRPLAERLRALTATATPPYRFDTADAPYGWSSAGPILELPTANGCDPMAPERTIQLRLSFAPGERWGTCYQVVNAASPVVGLANVRYVLSKSPLPLAKVDDIAGFGIYENPRVMPRFFFAPRIERAADLEDAARRMHALGFEPSKTALVEGDLASGGRSAGEVAVVCYSDREIRLRTHSVGDAFLVAADSWYPGWRLEIDGRRASLYPTDVAFRGVALPAGEHLVVMRFVPGILYGSAAVSGLALLAVLAALLAE